MKRLTLPAALALPLLALSLACGMAPGIDDPDGGGGSDGGSSGGNPAPQALIAEARATADAAMEGAEAARTVLEVLGLLPVYECGEPRQTFVGRVAPEFDAEVACATVSHGPVSADADEIVIDFGTGCTLEGHELAGTLVFTYSGGESRMDLALDVSTLTVDGVGLSATGGYGTCSDETRYWAQVSGPVPGQSGRSFTLDATVASRSGPPVIGGTTLLIDGTGTLEGPAGTDSLTATTLEYELGDRFPKSGTLLVQTATGHTVRVTFTPLLWSIGEAEIVIDDHDPVTIPVPR
ncbi:MAG: hypothetical protein P1V51_17640 [Deltaproteobacteria bacterium]|nr:hypothetical protein [Deltaproteobacteria bacterium]